MKASTEILIIGPGRLGQCMYRWLSEAGRSVRLIGKEDSIPSAAITWLTVPDRFIAQVAQALPKGGVVLHASGATDLLALEPHPQIGSLHPLMTFTGTEKRSEMPDQIPAAISGCETAKAAAKSLATDLGFELFEFEGDRRIYHAAAVLSGNFATILLAKAAALLATQGIPETDARRLLAPLAMRSIENASTAHPADVLTGPVARGDDQIIQRHQEAIASIAPEFIDLYDALLRNARNLA